MELRWGGRGLGVRGSHPAFLEQFWPALPMADHALLGLQTRELLSTNRVLSGQEVDTKGEFRGASAHSAGSVCSLFI